MSSCCSSSRLAQVRAQLREVHKQINELTAAQAATAAAATGEGAGGDDGASDGDPGRDEGVRDTNDGTGASAADNGAERDAASTKAKLDEMHGRRRKLNIERQHVAAELKKYGKEARTRQRRDVRQVCV